MRIGKLRYRITIEQSSETQTVGEPVRTWTTFATVWADYEDLGGSEVSAGGQDQFATGQRRWEIRYLTGVSPRMRVNDGTRTWDIDRVINVDGRNREMHLFCTGRSL